MRECICVAILEGAEDIGPAARKDLTRALAAQPRTVHGAGGQPGQKEARRVKVSPACGALASTETMPFGAPTSHER